VSPGRLGVKITATVCVPYLFDPTPGRHSQNRCAAFNGTIASEDETRQLVETINGRAEELGEREVDCRRLRQDGIGVRAAWKTRLRFSKNSAGRRFVHPRLRHRPRRGRLSEYATELPHLTRHYPSMIRN